MNAKTVVGWVLLLTLCATAKETGVKIDGALDDWKPGGPLIAEAGASGRGSFNGIDVKAVYVRNDSKNLYFFLATVPSLEAWFAETESSGGLCDIYIDTDNDSTTGCKDVLGFDYGEIAGYEFQIWMPVGQYSDENGTGVYSTYSLLPLDEDRKFNIANNVAEKSSMEDKQFIAHGKQGVEFAVSLQALGLSIGDTINLLIVEQAHSFDKEGYTKAQYSIQESKRPPSEASPSGPVEE